MADKEIELLDNVEMRFALADLESKFESQLAIYLAPVLLKLDSPHASVKTKVTSICGHVNKRLKSNPAIKIPIAAVCDLWTNTQLSNFVKNFALIYLEMGFARASEQETQLLLPKLIRGISTRLPSQQIVAFHIALPVLTKIKEPRTERGAPPPISDPFEFETNPADLKFLIDKFLDVMLFNIGPPPKPLGDEAPLVPPPPPGLSKAAIDFMSNAGKAVYVKSVVELLVVKVEIVRFLTSVFVPDKLLVAERFRVYLVASCETHHQVVSAGEDALRRHAKPDLEDEKVVQSLYELYQGTGRGRNMPVIPDPSFRMPANPAVKSKILTIFLKSAKAANIFPSTIQIIFDALYGVDANPKLRSLGISFMIWTAKMAETSKIRPVAPIIISGLLKLIEQAQEDSAVQEGETLRGFAYEAMGLVSKRGAPDLFVADTSILMSFFKAVSLETRNVRVSVQDALSMMIDAYKDIIHDDTKRSELEEIILSNIEKNEPQARYIATKYAVSLFPFSHPLSRYIALVASADSKLEVREEGRRGLKFPEAIAPNDTVETYSKLLPSFTDMASLLKRMRGRSGQGMVRAPGIKYVGAMSTESYSHALEFLQRLVVRRSDPTARIDDVGVVSDEAGEIADASTRIAVRNTLKTFWGDVNTMEVDGREGPGGLALFIDLIETALKAEESDALLQSVASSCMLELISLGPSTLSSSYGTKVDWIKSFLNSIRPETRQSMAHMLGIVVTASNLDRIPSLLTEMYNAIKTPPRTNPVEARHGAILAMGYIIGRLWYRHPYTATDIVTSKQIKTCTETLASFLNDGSALLITGACAAIGEVGRYAPLCLDALVKDAMDTDVDWSVSKIIEKLTSLAKNSKETKVQEAAIAALGDLALGDSSIRSTIISLLTGLCSALSKQPEIHFTVGGSLAMIGAGWQSTNTSVFLDIGDVEYPPTTPPPSDRSKVEVVGDETMDEVLSKCFAEVMPGRPPVNRKAVSVWLLCVIKHCGQHSRVKARFGDIHAALSSLLNDRDEFTQEVASKAMGLAYELADPEIRKSMVGSLISTITEGKRIAAQSVTAETPLFEAGTMGSTPDGGNLTTYQSILSLASDMNQPELVYKFMSLASHSAMWNSRRGASMGFAMVMAHAEEDLKPYLPNLIPRLFRFQFDPNAKVADAMRNIWRILVKDPKATITEYFVLIMKDLLKSLGDRLWRTREASCLAMSDLLQGRSIEQLEPYLQELWTMCFRVLDDIKESVRTAAFGTCKVLTNVTIKYCDPTVVNLKDGQKVMDACMPFLIQGLGSMAEEVRKFALSTILKLCQKGGVLLKPHVTEITTTLLESLSSLEPQVMNYLSFHTEKYNITQEQLDSSRLSAAKMSPMMEAIQTCVEQIDGKVLDELIVKLNQLIRKAVGLPTKAGCARFIASLAARVPQELKPHADSLLKALSGAIFDKSPAVSKSYAVATGHVIKLVSEGSLVKFIQHLKKQYLEGEDEETRAVSGIVLLEMSKQAQDLIKSYLGEILPLAYYGGRDANDTIKAVWRDVWDENTAGAASALRLYLNELMALLTNLLKTSPSWPTKRQVGVTITDMSSSISTSLVPQMPVLIPALLEALSGRTWDGKESVLESLSNVSVTCKEWFDGEGKSHLDEVSKVLIREAKKNAKPYKRVALEQLGKAFDALKIDKFDDLADYLLETATIDDEDDDKDKMDVDGSSREKPLALLVRANAFKALAGCFPAGVASTQAKHVEVLAQSLAKSMDNNVWNIRLAAIDATTKILEKLVSPPSEAIVVELIQGLLKPMADMKYVALRESALKALSTLFERVKGNMAESTRQLLITGIDTILERENMPSIKEKLIEIRKQCSGMDLA
ncbi:hypothetical protein SmJEL517_g00223 [Synchytrium microbalum]|uniref:TOG domain-containing protein n=1 Tax=Synchytrium microbalum TaxID=1806994 RepID=A0A507CK62_9FUNG|nr:uncharacterized protein SmJEL517_g00223 [Synchytrium microbalum]TPX38193.1 hypothetical protein SmJEL517_g00223 [Synchytrium microbalum]